MITDEEIIRTFLSRCKLRHFKYHARDTSGSLGGIIALGNSLVRVVATHLRQVFDKIKVANKHAVEHRSEYYPYTYYL